MTLFDKLKELYSQAAEQYECIMKKTQRIKKYPEYFPELTTFYRSCEKMMQNANHMAQTGLNQLFAITPPTEEKLLHHKKSVRFCVVFYELLYEKLAVGYDGYLCAPPHYEIHGTRANFPFMLTSYSDSYFNAKWTEAINNPGMVDEEIRRFRNRLYEGFKAYGEKNLAECKYKLDICSRLPYPL